MERGHDLAERQLLLDRQAAPGEVVHADDAQLQVDVDQPDVE
jgi:hypothetical protein